MPRSPQDVYARHLSSHRGYPLWMPEPSLKLLDYRQPQDGLRIGDVGVVTLEDGCFDVYFNVRLPRDHTFHRATGVPDNFEPVKLRDRDIRTDLNVENPGSVIMASVKSVRTVEQSTDNLTRIHQSGVEYQFNLSSGEGALLILPRGAERCNLLNRRLFLQAAIKHGADWYRFAEEKVGQIISHDSLYLITGIYKTSSWSLAAFKETEETTERPAQFKISQIGSNDIAASYRWEATRDVEWRVGPVRSHGIPNQSVFIRGFKIALQTRMFGTKWISVRADAPSTEPNNVESFGAVPGYSYLGNMLGGLPIGWTTQSSGRGTQDEVATNSGSDAPGSEVGNNDELAVGERVVVQSVPAVSQAFHPSDTINRYLLAKEPSATIAITHDDDWITMLEENLLQPEDLVQDGRLETLIAQKYDIISNQGVVYLQRQRSDGEGHIGDIGESATRLDLPESDVMNQLAHLTDAGQHALLNYHLLKNEPDLDEAINYFERALDLCPADSPNRSSALFNLTNAKTIQCQASNNNPDLDPLSHATAASATGLPSSLNIGIRNYPTPDADSTFFVSASIKLYKNNQPLVNVEKTIHVGGEHKEQFTPPLAVSLEDQISASINYSTKWRKRVQLSININLNDDGKMREEKGVRLYRRKKKNVEVVVNVYPQIPPLIATTTSIIQAYSRFRILIMGNSGVGKSSLLHKVFGVPDVKPTQNHRGETDIEREFTFPTDQRFVVHVSLGFEAGDECHMKIVQDFVAKRRNMSDMKDRLHAIWLCLEIPYAGGRLLETGVEKFLKMRRDILGDIPLVVVLTKVDLLDEQLEIDLPESETLMDVRRKYINEHCIKPLYEAEGDDVTHATVSVLDGYSESLSELLKSTDENMIKYRVGDTPRVMATIAQRISIKEKIWLSISIGKKKYWNTLLKSAAFRGRTLNECLKVIREDITQVWNFNDPDHCLMDDRITSHLLCTDNLEGVTGAAGSSNGASSGPGLYRSIVETPVSVSSDLSTVLKLAFPPLIVHERYQEAKKDVKILMAYIVDLISIMRIVFLLVSGNRVTDKTTTFAMHVYEDSRRVVHRSVEALDGKLGVLPGGRDYVLEKVEDLLWQFSVTDDQIQDLRLSMPQSLMPLDSGSS